MSTAKRGKPQIRRDGEEITLEEAHRVTGLSRPALRDGVDRGVLRAEKRPRPAGRRRAGEDTACVTIFKRSELLEDLGRCRCSYPNCEKPALGRSGRCGDHAARGEPALQLTCRHCGEQFTRPRSWLKELDGRGHYCTNRCKGLAVDVDRLRTISPNGAERAREHHAHVTAQIAADGMMDAPTLAARTFYSTSVIRDRARRGVIPSELRVIDGIARLVFPADADVQYARAWVGSQADAEQAQRRANYLDADRIVRQQLGLGRITLTRERDELHARVNARREWFLRYRGGRPPTTAIAPHHWDWWQTFDEIRENYVGQHWFDPRENAMVSDWEICREVAHEDFAVHPERWDYDPATSPRAAANRVSMAIKALQSAHRKTPRE